MNEAKMKYHESLVESIEGYELAIGRKLTEQERTSFVAGYNYSRIDLKVSHDGRGSNNGNMPERTSL